MAKHLNPGPQINDLLHSNDEHRANHLFNGSIPLDKVLTVRRHDRLFWEFFPYISNEVKLTLGVAGFGGFVRVGNRKIDNALITALVERWRPETHTFHFPIGEAIVTLQDVEVLWGLRTDGSVVTGTDEYMSLSACINKCEDLMRFTPPPEAIEHCTIKLSCLYEEITNPLPPNATLDQIYQKTRVVLMHLFGGTLFPNTSGNKVFLYHLNNIVDLDACSQLSWGSAVLACLYRRLCKASKYKAADISGPLGLLQLWAWERIQILAPTLVDNNFHFAAPYGARWNISRRTYQRVTSHVLQAFRSQLTSLKINQFNWTPYSEDVLNSLPRYCTRGRTNWRCETYIIYWEIVETHLPSRVMRQFGMFQPIPNIPLFDYSTHIVQHKLSRVNRANVNWEHHHASYIQHWYHRFVHIHNGNQVSNFAFATNEYMRWYMPRTVIYITNPTNVQQGFQPLGEAREFLMDGMTQIYNQSTGMMRMNPPNTQCYEDIQNTASQYMQYIQGENWLRQGPSHFQEDYQPVSMQQVQRAPRERRQQRQPDANAGSSNAFAGTSNPYEDNQDVYLDPDSIPNKERSWLWYW